MEKRVRVGILYADEQGCGWYRCALPAVATEAVGVDALLVEQLMTRQVVDNATGWKRVTEVPPVDADVIVFQRPMNRILIETMTFVREQGVGIVVELDDDLENVPRANIAWTPLHSGDPSIGPRWLREAARLADVMTVSTPALANRYRRDVATCVVPNGVHAEWLDIPRPETEERTAPVVGWTGTVGNHPRDLQEMGSTITNLVHEGTALFRTVGQPEGVSWATGLEQGEFRSTGWLGLEEYPHRVAEFDIGVVPLESNKFNSAKSWLKGLEFAALGIPFVASPTPEYLRLNRDYGIGILARSPSEWNKQLRRLIRDEDWRRALGEDWRATVRRKLTVDVLAPRWSDAWEAAARAGRARRTRYAAAQTA